MELINKLLHLFLPHSCLQGEFACSGFCFLIKAGLLLLAAPSSNHLPAEEVYVLHGPLSSAALRLS